MGFPSGFISGITLTSATLYLTLLIHQRNRQQQADSLRQQHTLLNSIFDPNIIPVDDPPRFVQRRISWTETWKDRWNEELESAVRWAHDIKWEDVRALGEGAFRSIRDTARHTTAEEGEQAVEAVDGKSRDFLNWGIEKGKGK